MMYKLKKWISLVVIPLSVVLIFLSSCLIALTDGQGAIVFVFTLPLMAVFLALGALLSRTIGSSFGYKLSKIISGLLALFFFSLFVPGLRFVPQGFLGVLGKSFEAVVGMSPYAYAKARRSFPRLFAEEVHGASPGAEVDMAKLEVTFAWDHVCIFGPYTDAAKAKSILKIDWNIEDHSQIHDSDSIHCLVFLYEGKVNQVVDLSRGVADFQEGDRCLERRDARFTKIQSPQGRVVLEYRDSVP